MNIIWFLILDSGGYEEWIGDSFCDDVNNNEYCHYDNGDCCGQSVKKQFCLNCTALKCSLTTMCDCKYYLLGI